MTVAHPGRSATPVRPPTTRDEVDAHRYSLRRLESALVRADPIPLDEQLRSQRRATMVGALLGLLGLVAAAVLAAVAPKPLWQHENLVVGEQSGAVYAVAHDPDRLVPVADAVVGRLVLAAMGTAVPEAQVRIVPDELLAGARRDAPVNLPGVVAVQPSASPIPERWAVCDEMVRGRTVRTTVLAGTLAPQAAGAQPAAAQLYLTSRQTGPFVVVNGRRHAFTSVYASDEAALRTALGLAERRPVEVSPELVAAIPEGRPLEIPIVAGGPGPNGVPGRPGDLLVATSIDGEHQYLVILPGAVQEIPATLADALRAVGGAGPEEIDMATLKGLPRPTQATQIDVEGWPASTTSWADPVGQVCWTWVETQPGMLVAPTLPKIAGAVTVPLPNARASAVVITAGGPVRAWSPTGGGSVWLVSAAGVGYGVADSDTATALGVPQTVTSAPEGALRLLPAGSRLDVADARVALGMDARPRVG